MKSNGNPYCTTINLLLKISVLRKVGVSSSYFRSTCHFLDDVPPVYDQRNIPVYTVYTVCIYTVYI